MGHDLLGEFEHQVLLAVLRRQGEAYSVPLVTELEERTGRDVSAAAVHIALKRLEEKGFATSEMRRKADQKGRSRRYFEVTDAGREILRESRRRFVRLWEGLEPELGASGE